MKILTAFALGAAALYLAELLLADTGVQAIERSLRSAAGMQ